MNTEKVTGPTAAWLLDQIEDFLSFNDMDNDGCLFGWHVAKDRSLVQRLRDGRDITTTRMDEILQFMQNPIVVITSGGRAGETRDVGLKPMKIKRKVLP